MAIVQYQSGEQGGETVDTSVFMAIVQYQSVEQGGETVDRLSFLPKLLLHHKLSFIPTREVVKTCVLAKRWRNIWCSIPSLEFHVEISFDVEEEDYVGLRDVKFVDYVLLLRERSDVQKFCLSFWSKIGDIARVNVWITHAIRHHVQVLDIKQHFSEEVELTPHIFTCKSLQELTIYSKKLNLPAVYVCLPFLKFLELGNVIIKDGQLLEPLFLVSPSLETFILDHCQVESDQLTISAHQLKHLIMRKSLRNSIIISAPNLISVELGSCYGFRATVRFDRQLNCLSEATLDVKLKSSLALVHSIHTVRNARYLKLFASTLSSFCEELQNDLFFLEWIQTPFNHLKRLMIGTCFFDGKIMFINHLLKHSPGVESVDLENTIHVRLDRVEKNEQYGVEKVWFKYNIPHLKFVEFNGFRASDNEVRLVKFFLRNAINLEKLIIRIAWSNQFYPINDQIMTTITRLLSTNPRSSSSAILHFVEP